MGEKFNAQKTVERLIWPHKTQRNKFLQLDLRNLVSKQTQFRIYAAVGVIYSRIYEKKGPFIR